MDNTTKNIQQILRARIEKAKAEGRLKSTNLKANEELIKKLKEAREKAIAEGKIRPMQPFNRAKLAEVLQRMKAAKEGK